MSDDDDSEWTALDAAEARLASGFIKRGGPGSVSGDGKHVMADGLVARSGRRRILPEEDDWALNDMLAGSLERLVPQVLHGRSATIFEGRILNPLLQKPRVPIASLATQFGISPARVYKILHRCNIKLMDAWARLIAKARANTDAQDRLDRLAKLEACPRAYECCLLLHPNAIYGDPGCHQRRPRLANSLPKLDALRPERSIGFRPKIISG